MNELTKRTADAALHDRRGTAAIEFAILAPVLAMMTAAVVELGVAVDQRMQVQDAAAAGALYAVQNGWSQSGIAAAVAGAKPGAGISASPAPALYCGCPTSAGIATAACGADCADGSAARRYVRVSASSARKSFIASRLPLPATIAASTVASIP